MEKVGRRQFLGSAATALFATPLLARQNPPKSFVMVLPVLHKQHLHNKLYSYDDVYRIVSDFNPDQVGVEIRQEDMVLSDAYLDDNYPAEMVHLARLYGARAFGFDWLGDELANRPVPEDWWTKQSRIKQLERALDETPLDTSPHLKILNMRIDRLSDEQERIIKTSTADQLANGPYDGITSAYYKNFRLLTQGTPYADISRFYSCRDAHLTRNVIQRLKGTGGIRVAIVTGADHHGPMVKALASMHTVELVRVPSAPNQSTHGR